ncbi:MAG: hypothetical protein GF364_05905 [Candidatus Lokiarchaeota archaeon]|nr:hypothetical protein [Candidatus Lokiarchaeota archaeon]
MSWKERFAEKQRSGILREEEEGKKHQDIDRDILVKYKGLTFFQEISESFKLFFLNFHVLSLVFLILGLIFSVTAVFLFTDMNHYFYEEYWVYTRFNTAFETGQWMLPEELSVFFENQLSSWQFSLLNRKLVFDFILIIFKFTPFILGSIMISYYLSEKVKGNKVSLLESIKRPFSKQRRKSTILMIVLYTIISGLGIAILFIPGILFLMIAGFGFFFASRDEVGLIKNFKGSFYYGGDFRIKTFGLLLIGLLFYLFLGNFITGLILPNLDAETYMNALSIENRDWLFVNLYELARLIPQLIFQPLMVCVLAVQYVEIGVKKEFDWDINKFILTESARDREELELDKDSKKEMKRKKLGKKNIAHRIKSKGGKVKFYCPQCGERISPSDKKGASIIKCKSCGMLVILK